MQEKLEMLNDRLDQVTGEKGIDTEEGVDGAQSIKQSVKKCECRCGFRGRSQLSTFMKAFREYARGEGVWDHCTLFS